MILVKNSPFGPSLKLEDTHQEDPYQQSITLDSLENQLFCSQLDEIDQILTSETFRQQHQDKSDLKSENDNFSINFDCEEDEDLKFLELDLCDSNPDTIDDDINSLNPSVQRLFCQTSMSNYSSASSALSCSLEDQQQTPFNNLIFKHNINNSNNLNCGVKPNLSYRLVRQDSQLSQFGSVVDSNYGSGSSSSSTPSTPSSTVGGGGFGRASGETQTPKILPPHLSGISSTTLPSFSEIYSPQYSDEGGESHHFECGAEFFKFEDYISESESDVENNYSIQKQQLFDHSLPESQFANHHQLPTVVVKEEPMDHFVTSITNSLENELQTKESNSSFCDSIFDNQRSSTINNFKLNSLNNQMITSGSLKLKCNEETASFSLFTSDNPKQIASSFLIEPETNLAKHLNQPLISLDSNSMQIDLSTNTYQLSTLQDVNSRKNIDSISSINQVSSSCETRQITDISFRNGKNRIRTKSAPQQTCAVCGDVAACQHYGVLTCEGCKGFFKRTVQKNSKYTCLGNRDCTVDKRRRNRCQFCRFQKCLAVGMVKEVVRTDNLKGRRGRLPSKPKCHQEVPVTPPLSTIASLIKAHDETSADKANLDFSQFNENVGEKCQIGNHFGNIIDQQVLSLLSNSLESLRTFMEKIPDFSELKESDKQMLFQNSCLELFALRMAYRITPGAHFIVLCNNIVLHRNQFIHTLGEWLPMIEELSRQIQTMKMDLNAFACLCALNVISGRGGLQDTVIVEQIENKVITALKDHSTYNNDAQKKPFYFSRVLSKLPELRTIGEIGLRVISSKIRGLPQEHMTKEIVELKAKITPINQSIDIIDHSKTVLHENRKTLMCSSNSTVFSSFFKNLKE